MMRVLLVMLAFLALPASAQTARVTSGEHDDFTRLVVEFPTAADWQLGRTDTGYALVLVGAEQPRYDLTAVWDRIPRTRLRAVWAAPEGGALNLTPACACHAFPFELRPGMVVIDIKEGPAPAGSAFELALDGSTPPPLVAATVPRPELRPLSGPTTPSVGYDWLATTAAEATPKMAVETDAALTLPLPTGSTSLAPLRDALLHELSRGAAEGVVDMTLPAAAPSPEAVTGDLPWSRIVIGEVPGVTARSARDGAVGMQPDGAACIADAQLAIADWGNDDPGALQLATARSGLMGEFDVADPEATLQAVRHHLFLGFGAEALQYLRLIEAPTAPDDLEIYAGIARILDGIEDPGSPFAPMLGCDGPAALWATLQYTRLPSGAGVNVAAVLRSFAALPPHLRQHLGPDLAEQFLGWGDAEAARMVRDATARVPGVAARDMALMDAKAGLAEGRAEEAAADAETALAGGGPAGIDALLALVEARFRKGEPVGPDLAEAVGAYLSEARGTEAEPALNRAMVLALALAGDLRSAIAALAMAPEAETDLWQVIAARATDADLLAHAILGATTPRPAVEDATALALGSRLAALGFADAALDWLGPVAADAAPEVRLLAAAAELARGDARRARDLSSGLEGPEAKAILADALTRLGAIDTAAEAWRSVGDDAQAARLKTWQRDWVAVSADAAEPWQAAARLAVPAPSAAADDRGLLAQGAALADDSAAARQAIADLLAGVPDPARLP
jgi:hypothetical protein